MKKSVLAAVAVFVVSVMLMMTPALAAAQTVKLAGKSSFSVQGSGYYAKSIEFDATGDGKLTAADARKLLRASAKLEALPEPDAEYDLDGDGKLSASDARLALRLSARIAKLVCRQDGTFEQGLVACDDGALRFITKSGELAVGRTDIGEKRYYFDESTGKSRSGFVVRGGVKEYYAEDGALFDGVCQVGDDLYYFRDNRAQTGSFFIGKDAYLFGEDGAMVRNQTIGYFKYGDDGKASLTELNDETLDWKLDQILAEYGSTWQDIHNYMKRFPYRSALTSTERELAIQMLKTGRGACYHYAALTKLLLVRAGYEAVVVDGYCPKGGYHNWVMVKVDGSWRHMDVMYDHYFADQGPLLMTDAFMRSKGYVLNTSKMPGKAV